MATLKNTTISDTGFLQLPVGTTGQRPTPANGQMRFNTSTGKAEFYNATAAAWVGTAVAGVVAAGGTVYDVDVEGTTYRVHVFTDTGNSTFNVSKGGQIEYLIVAGGGSGGSGEGNPAGDGPGGGGAGGLLTGFTTVTPQTYTITVGSGASTRVTGTSQNGLSGADSSAFSLTAIGGGRGAREEGPGGAGGSGGGGGGSCISGRKAGGAGTAGQGNAGGTGGDSGCSRRAGAGGGGAGIAGGDDRGSLGGNGGNGLLIGITGLNVYYAGGGGGGNAQSNGGTPGTGGYGGGGAGGISPSGPGTDATPNTGGGGGATGSGTSTINGLGGSGIVVVRYPLNQENPVQSSARIVENDLLLDFDFAKPTVYPGSGSTVNDSRINGISGTLTNSPRFTDSYTHRSSFSFNGSDQYINAGTIDLQRDFTLELWANCTASTASGFFGQGPTAANSGLHVGWFPGRGLLFGMYANDLEGPAYNMVYGVYHHFVFTYNHTTFNKQTWADGVLVSEGALNQYSGSGQFNIGAIYGNPIYTKMNGNIGAARVYTKILTPSEILNNFNVTRWRYGV